MGAWNYNLHAILAKCTCDIVCEEEDITVTSTKNILSVWHQLLFPLERSPGPTEQLPHSRLKLLCWLRTPELQHGASRQGRQGREEQHLGSFANAPTTGDEQAPVRQQQQQHKVSL
ncbi:unnamed protein product [Polarella glacialis]|uniref:Uncharacterized protein n=1 Tax=Polarella glacialis TaxID=89957 RepID=A0A813L4Z3_POLGL|nr:unnamed protein product [Polarella glacialis]